MHNGGAYGDGTTQSGVGVEPGAVCTTGKYVQFPFASGGTGDSGADRFAECGGLGVVLDIPLGHKDAAFVRSHFDGMEVRISDAPRAKEIMVAIAVTDSGRPLARVGGLTKGQIKGEDGLR